jgi:hypothetical protein
MITRRRAIGWFLFGLALAGLGYGLHEMLPQEPRWTLSGIHQLTATPPCVNSWCAGAGQTSGEGGISSSPISAKLYPYVV